MTIFDIGNDKYAVGKRGELAGKIVRKSGKELSLVRGRRPIITEEHKKAPDNIAEAVRTFLKESAPVVAAE